MTPHSVPKMKKQLAAKIQKNQKKISEWYMAHAKLAPPPFYSSVDLRDSGFKIVPVDSNLYPAGFNNVCPEDLRTAPPIFRKALVARAEEAGVKDPKKILILP